MDHVGLRKEAMVGSEHRESREGLEEDDGEMSGEEYCSCIQMLDGQW